jgi:hypothetical membrane protein
MNLRSRTWFRIAGLCGVITPLVAFTCILLAIAYSPRFSWTENALSDLGVQEGLTVPLFNYGLIISGAMSLVFASGILALLRNKLVGKVGSFTFALATLALIAIGIFPENARPMHYFASVAFFALIPIAMLVLMWAFAQVGKVKTALYTLLVAIVAAVPWVIQFAVHYVSDVAIPETISALSASAWTIALGFMMLKKASKKDN